MSVIVERVYCSSKECCIVFGMSSNINYTFRMQLRETMEEERKRPLNEIIRRRRSLKVKKWKTFS